MNRTRCLIALGVLLALAGTGPLRAASREDRDYAIATNLFKEGVQWPASERQFTVFIATYTNSARLPEAILYLSRSRIEQSNYTGALQLLEPAPTGRLAPDYIYWAAQAYFGNGDYLKTVSLCSNLLLNFPTVPALRLGAAYLQAQAFSELRDWPAVIGLLSVPNGPFQTAPRGDPVAVNGFFLLAQAYLNREQYTNAEGAIQQIQTNNLTAELKWRRQFLLCQVLFDAGQTGAALTNSDSLAALGTNQPQRTANAFLRGEILEQVGLWPDALKEYTNNLAEGLPADVNRQALSRTIALLLMQNQTNAAMQRLEDFIGQRPKDPNLDLARLSLGDLQLKGYFDLASPDSTNSAATATNELLSAITNLDRVIQDFTNSPLLGQARLDRGWTDWTKGQFADATNDFFQAVNRLTNSGESDERAVALFKLADAQFQVGDYAAASENYNRLLNEYNTTASVTNELFDLALYQLVKTSLKLNRESAANDAVEHILKWFPTDGFGDRSLLLLGEDANRKSDYAGARTIFGDLLKKYPDTPLLPEVQFAIVRTFEQEGDWTNALAASESWISNPNFATNTLLPQVEFARALASGKIGLETNALNGMSNIVSQFPSNDLAPLAQNWIGDYHISHGDNAGAVFAYQNLWRKFPNATNLVYRAYLMAGRAALPAPYNDLTEASNDFYFLVSNTNTPAPLQNEALFQLGYTDYLQFQANPTNKLAYGLFSDAIFWLSKVTNVSASNVLAPQAFGQLGNCWMAWAHVQTNAADKTNYLTNAFQMFEAVVALPNADITSRSEAECGLGLCENGLNHPDEELRHYLNVVYNDTVEEPDPAWVSKAGVFAAQWYIDRGQWADAITVYTRVGKVVPSLQAEMEKDIKIATTKAESQRP